MGVFATRSPHRWGPWCSRHASTHAAVRLLWTRSLRAFPLSAWPDCPRARCCRRRPCPIGLSVAQVVAVEGRTLVLGGADIVDGSPILDIKPFVPFCDNVHAATAPPWVAAKVRGGCSFVLAACFIVAASRQLLGTTWLLGCAGCRRRMSH